MRMKWPRHRRPWPLLLGVLLISVYIAARCQANNDVAGTLIQFNDNGAWSWFEDERAIVDAAAGKILVSSVGNSAGTATSKSRRSI
jgi:hypothetical protein